MATSIKITSLGDIGNNLAPSTILPVVNMTGTPETQKVSTQNLGNLILDGAGGASFVPARQALTAGTVTTAAQPNITSTGTLTALSVTGNVNVGNVNTTGLFASGNISASNANLGNAALANYFVGNGTYLTSVSVSAANVTGLGNVASINLDGNVANVLTGTGTFVTLPIINGQTVVWTTAPESNTSTGVPGAVAYDTAGSLYVCVATDTWSKFTGTLSW